MPQVILNKVHSVPDAHLTRNSLQAFSPSLLTPFECNSRYLKNLSALENVPASATPEHNQNNWGTRILVETTQGISFYVCASQRSCYARIPLWAKRQLQKCKYTLIEKILQLILVSEGEEIVVAHSTLIVSLLYPHSYFHPCFCTVKSTPITSIMIQIKYRRALKNKSLN